MFTMFLHYSQFFVLLTTKYVVGWLMNDMLQIFIYFTVILFEKSQNLMCFDGSHIMTTYTH